MELIQKYFELTERQKEQFAALDALYRDWNAKINVISRKDIDNLYEHHVLHSLAIDIMLDHETLGLSKPITRVLDVGTGGGFPGIPLAISNPEIKFTLIDSIGKKVRVAEAVAEGIGLTNCEFRHQRIQECRTFFDVIVSRAVMSLPELIQLTHKNGRVLICLKGGDVDEEIMAASDRKREIVKIPVSDYFEEEWFKEKYIIIVR